MLNVAEADWALRIYQQVWVHSLGTAHCLCVFVCIRLSAHATRYVTFCVYMRVCVSVLQLCPGTLFNSPNLLERFQMCRPVIYGPCLWWGMIKRCCLILWTLHSHSHYLLPEHTFIKSRARVRERERASKRTGQGVCHLTWVAPEAVRRIN